MNSCALDVGAHWGEVGLEYARQHPDIPVYAFEPDVRDAARIATSLDNYHVLAVAIDETDGIGVLRVNQVPGCSSLHPLDGDGLRAWPGGKNFAEIGLLTVPTLRLDTFLDAIGYSTVAWLKVDTQGHDLAVLRSLGARLADVQHIVIEVCVADRPTYQQAPTHEDILDFLTARGFVRVDATPQTQGYEENWTFERCHD